MSPISAQRKSPPPVMEVPREVAIGVEKPTISAMTTAIATTEMIPVVIRPR